MSKTPKINRVWNKQEKRIVRLLYRKGFDIDLSNLYWVSYKKTGKKYRCNGSTFSSLGYRDEVYFCIKDYWGEYEEHSLVDVFIEMKTWENIPADVLKNCDHMSEVYSLSNFQYKSRKWLIKYLSALPTVRCDSKINKILKITTN